MGEWIKHDGTDMPVDGRTLVIVRYKDGTESHEAGRPASFWWDHDKACNNWHAVGEGSDIVQYRLASTDKEGE